MRADRLISLLMLLQSHARMTARDLAAALEVSERTILRDVDALSASGVPVYTERGPQGGIALLEDYRTELTGLTDSELRAVFLLSIPSAIADLGLDRALASALQKLSASIAGRQGEVTRTRQRFYLDPAGWHPGVGPTPQLAALRDATWRDRRAQIRYRLPSGPTSEQWVHPYGLVAKERSWYLVCLPERRAPAGVQTGHQAQVLSLSVLEEVRISDEAFVRQQDFDLVKVWERWCEGHRRPPFELTLRVVPSFAPRLDSYGIQVSIRPDAAQDAEGRVAVTATCESFEDARAKVLALGCAVEVIAPAPLRRSVLDYAEQITRRYKSAC